MGNFTPTFCLKARGTRLSLLTFTVTRTWGAPVCIVDVFCVYNESALRVHFTGREELGVREMLWKRTFNLTHALKIIINKDPFEV